MTLSAYQMQSGALVDYARTTAPAVKQLYVGAADGHETLDTLDSVTGFNTQIARRFNSGFPSAFPLDDVGKRATIFSFKPSTASGGQMDNIAAGSGAGFDTLNALIDSIPSGHPAWLCLWHEPEDNFTTTTARTQYINAWNAMADAVHSRNRPELKTCWIMTAVAWVTGNKYQYPDYLVDLSKVDAIGIDVYNDGSLRNPQRWDTLGLKLGRPDPTESLSPIGGGYSYTSGALGYAADNDLPLIVTEWGSIADHQPVTVPAWCTNAGVAATRPAWIEYTMGWMHDQPEIIACTYSNFFGRTWAGDSSESWELYHDNPASFQAFGQAAHEYASAKGLI